MTRQTIWFRAVYSVTLLSAGVWGIWLSTKFQFTHHLLLLGGGLCMVAMGVIQFPLFRRR